MPEYLAPGVYVEETSFRAKVIEGVSTTTTGFIGAARFGPVTQSPDILTGLGEFEYAYGSGKPMVFGGGASALTRHHYLWHAARSFFEEGGKRLYVARIFNPLPLKADGTLETDPAQLNPYAPPPATAAGDSVAKGTAATDFKDLYADGHARLRLLPDAAAPAKLLLLRARFPGSGGNLRVRAFFRFGQNLLKRSAGVVAVSSLLDRDLVLIDHADASNAEIHLALFDQASGNWSFKPAGGGAAVALSALDPDNAAAATRQRLRVLSLALAVEPIDGSRAAEVWDGLALDPAHTRGGTPDSASARFGPLPATAQQALRLPIEWLPGSGIADGLALLDLLAPKPPAPAVGAPGPKPDSDLYTALRAPDDPSAKLVRELLLTGGSDGLLPTAAEYAGRADDTAAYKTGLMAFEDIEDIAIVAAPGSTYGFEADLSGIQAIVSTVVAHCERMRYRIAVLDSGNHQHIADVRAMRARFDSTYAALYYPWVMVRDPITRTDIALPPSGFVAGIYARNDVERGVWKAPANEVVRGATGFELMLNRSQQEVLNPEGINCFRFFEGRGMRLWGARTISSDGEWKYVNVRRYFCYLERSIDKGTQWAVFEPNGEHLWANVRRTVEDFLLSEWQAGALLGERPDKAFFVRCDRSTMTQNDLDNGRLICLVGVAPLKPAEFVIFRIGQWTADSKR